MTDDNHEHDLYGTGLLGEALAPKRTGNLAERFLIPPFTVFSARDGFWQDRKRAWIALGIQSELGRGGDQGTRGFKDQASPGGSPMPAMDYKNRERGTGTGKPITGTAAQAPVAAVPITVVAGVVAPPVRAQPRAVKASPVTAAPRMPEGSWRPPELSSLPSLRGQKIEYIGYDIEATGLNPRKDKIIGVSLAIGCDGPRLYLPFGHEGGDNLPEENVKRWLKDEVAPLSTTLIGSYLLFDLEFSARWGLIFPNVTAFHDILVAEPLIDEWQLSYSLEALGVKYTGAGKNELLLREAASRYGWTTPTQVKANLHKLAARYIGPYAVEDADLPIRIFEKQTAIMKAEELERVYEVERRQIPVNLAMRLRGVPFDVPRANVLLDKLNAELKSWTLRLHHAAGKEINPRGDDLGPVLRSRGFDLPLTAKGKDSITESWLVAHRSDTIIDAVLVCRRISVLVSYAESLLKLEEGGRIYPTFNQLKRTKDDGSGSGTMARYSCTDPNLQQIGKREKPADELIDMNENLAAATRKCFPAEPGEVYQRDDTSQAEFRLNVNIAIGNGAEEARERYRTDPAISFHRMCGEMAGIDPNDKSQYDKIKGLNLGKSYGAQGKRVASILGCSLEDANIFVRRYEEALPFTVVTFNKAKEMAELNGFVRTYLGRRQRFPLWEPRGNRGKNWRPPLLHDRALSEYGQNIVRSKTYAALNRYCQGSAADVFKKGLADMWDAGVFNALGAPLLLVHDEIDTSVPQTKEGAEAARELTRIMGECVTLKVPLLIETSQGPTWGDCA
jgi:DNA polymerase I-like protein with 3'-5' exonuclease and polymerase domains